ncbi:MAG: tRNA (adenosine(37)-N6)-dimethylallyltransferase MiaA [Elusimicrobia bacterium]|nr:tRNA (adenosine(37)-N6)-dimethylallyltransferase MiaA [Elusimicrobiota bacterium]
MRQAAERPVLAVVGPTASGKTELAVDLARELGGEVVSADSRQVYRRLDAGTAKPARDSSGLVDNVPYHMLDLAEPSQAFDAGRFARMGTDILNDIIARGRRPIVAGGTGLYVRALLEGLSEMPAKDESVRRKLEAQAERHGRAWLHERLRVVDSEAAAKIPANNIQRTLRALEVYELTGRPMSSFWRKPERAPRDASYLLIEWPAAALKERIEGRARSMWPAMLRETRRLLAGGFSGAEPGFQSLGYRQAVSCLRGELTEDEGLAGLMRATCAYAKRQRTWFRHQTPAASIVAGGTRREMLSRALEALGSAALAR